MKHYVTLGQLLWLEALYRVRAQCSAYDFMTEHDLGPDTVVNAARAWGFKIPQTMKKWLVEVYND